MTKRPAFPLGIEMQLLSEQNESNLLAKINYSKSFQLRSPPNQMDYYCPSTNDRKQFSFEKKNEFIRQFADNMLENVRKINKLTNFHLNLVGDLGGSEEFNLQRKSSFSLKSLNYEQKRFFANLKESILNQWEKLPLIYPDNVAKMIWDIIAVVARLYFLYIIPIDLAWVENQFIFHDYFNISLVFLLLLLSDMILSLNTVYYKNGEAVKSRKEIIKHSLYNTYGMQWLSVLQLLVYFIFNSYHHVSLDVDNQLVNVGLLIFLVHHKTIITYASSYEEGLNLSKQTSSILALFKLIAFLFYVIHLLSCFWFWVRQLFNLQTGRYSLNNYDGKSWIAQTNMQDQTFNTQYLQAFYYIAVTIFTVGYGDVTPQSSLEKVIAIFMIMVSSIQLPFSVNTVGTIITEMTANSEEKKRKLRIINSYMKQNGTSSGLQVQVRKYLSYFWENIIVSKSDEEKQIIDSLSEFLREQLVSEAHSNIFNQCTLFKIRFSDKFKKQLIKEVEEILLSPEQELKFSGDIVLYFIEEGSIQVCLQQGRKISFGTVYKGASIGLKNFIIGAQAQESYKSVGFTKAMLLKRENFMKILQEYPDDYEMFCSIRDQLIFNKGEQIFPVKCFSCQSYQHKLIDCPLVTYIPDKEFLLKQHIFPKQQIRSSFNRIQKKHNTLTYNRKQLDQCALLIQNEQPPLMQIYKFDNILNIDEDQFRRGVKKSQSVHNLAQVEEKKRRSNRIITLLEVDDPIKKKFRFLVNKLIQMNKFYPVFLIQTYGKFERMIEQRNVNNILQILEQRIKNINSLNNRRFDQYLTDIQYIISKLQTKTYIDDIEFESPKNYKFYFRNSNFSKVKQKNYQKSFSILKKFIYYVQFPGQVIRKYNLKQVDLYWQINRRRQNICFSALPLTT